jgi:hypothetical protein
VVVNGAAGRAPVLVNAAVGAPVPLDAAGTRDPDGDALRYAWFFYPEAGTGIPGRPVTVGRRVPSRVTLAGEATPRVMVTAHAEGTAHVILAVEDSGSPTLTSYRRVILSIRAK